MTTIDDLLADLSAPHTKAGRTQRAVLRLLAEHANNDGIPTNLANLV